MKNKSEAIPSVKNFPFGVGFKMLLSIGTPGGPGGGAGAARRRVAVEEEVPGLHDAASRWIADRCAGRRGDVHAAVRLARQSVEDTTLAVRIRTLSRHWNGPAPRR